MKEIAHAREQALGPGMDEVCWKAEWAPLARRFAGEIAVTDADGPVRYEALYAAAAGIATRLIDERCGAGDIVATMVPNARHAVAASLGTALAGVAEAPINLALSAGEIAHCLRLSGARRLITTRRLAPDLADLGVEVRAVEEMEPGAIESLPGIRVDGGAWGRVMFTSGTTGKPKGIVHSQGGRWLANLLLRATLPVAPRPGREILLMTPYSHGASLMTQAFLDGGGAVRLLDGVDVEAVSALLEGGAVDQIFAPPTVLAKLVAGLEGRRIEGVEAIFCGTAPLSGELYRQARAIFGPVIRITYGKTEVFNPITVLVPDETERWYDDPRSASSVCVGWPASGVEVAIGESDGAVADDAPAAGPVLIRARHMMAATITEDGIVRHEDGAFHRTGDLGFVDEKGRLHLTGREADVIKTGGYRVTPEEIEGHLRPALARGELVVLGLPSRYWGEVITVVAAGAPEGWQEALAPAIDGLTRYKRPRLFAEIPEIGRNSLGKIVRSKARETVLADYRLVDGRYPTLERR